MENDRSGLYIVAIIAVVAVVSLVVMTTEQKATRVVNTGTDVFADTAGQSYTKTIIQPSLSYCTRDGTITTCCQCSKCDTPGQGGRCTGGCTVDDSKPCSSAQYS